MEVRFGSEGNGSGALLEALPHIKMTQQDIFLFDHPLAPRQDFRIYMEPHFGHIPNVDSLRGNSNMHSALMQGSDWIWTIVYWISESSGVNWISPSFSR